MVKKIVFGLIAVSLLASILFHSGEFSTEKWINSPQKRADMVDDFISTYKIIGMTKTEIINLLGEPENLYFQEPDNIAYYLGDEPGLFGFFAIDSQWIVISFNENDQAIHYEFKTD